MIPTLLSTSLGALVLGPLGMPELIFIMLLALLIFGPKRLPEMGRTLGRGMSEFRKASNDLKRTIQMEIDEVEKPAPVRRPQLAAEPTPIAAPDAGPQASQSVDDEKSTASPEDAVSSDAVTETS